MGFFIGLAAGVFLGWNLIPQPKIIQEWWFYMRNKYLR